MNALFKFLSRTSLILALAVMSIITVGLIGTPTHIATAQSGGPTLPYTEVQAEDSSTNGTIIGPNRWYPGLATEAIGRKAVTLSAQGQYVEFTVPQNANSIVLRYSIPDSSDGSGLTAPLSLYIGGTKQADLSLTSKYGYFYGDYPFDNNPADVRGHHFYDEVHRLVGQMSQGTKVRVQIDAGDNAPSYTIDLMDFEQVAAAANQPAGSLSITTDFGADASGNNDSTTAIQNAVNSASSQGKVLWIPQGTFKINTQIHVNNVTIQGAGIWYSTLHFITPTGNSEGLYGNSAPTPSTNVHLSDFAILGEVVTRNDNDQINGIGGALSNSSITDLWIEHTKCGMWLDGPFDGLNVTNVRIRDIIADGVNFHKAITNSTVTQSMIRNTGDDALAMWSDSNGTSIADSGDTFSFNRVEIPVLANGIALYGGTNNSITDNYVGDQQAEGGGIHVGNRFWPVTPVSGTINILRNTIVRSGSEDYYHGWNYGTGALWFWALNAPMNATINVNDNQIIDSNYEAINFTDAMSSGYSITNITFNRDSIIGTGTYPVEVRVGGGGSATFNNVTATGLGANGIYNCGSSFQVINGTGNGSWINAGTTCPGSYPTPVYGPVSTSTPTPLPSATTSGSGTPIISIDAGGSASGSYVADTDFDSGTAYSDTTTSISTSAGLDVNPAPQAVYQTVRWNTAFNYTIPGLTAGSSYTVILHWAELTWQVAGKRLFNVAINGTTVLSNFDVFATAGYKQALSKAFTATANGSGQIVISFTNGGADNPFINGIQILTTGIPNPTNTPVPPTNTNTPAAGEAPYGGTAWSMPGTVQIENYDTGGQNVGYSKASAGTSGLSPAYRSDEVAQIEGAGDTGGGYDVGWTNPNDWYKYTVNVTAAGSYNLNVRVASPYTTAAYHVEVDGTNVTGTVTIPNTGGWQTYSTLTTTGVSLTAGQHVLRLYVENGGMNLNWISISAGSATNTPTPVPPTNTPVPGEAPYGGTAWSMPGTVEVENYDTGGQNVGYSKPSAGTSGLSPAYRSDEAAQIEAAGDTGGGYDIGWNNTNDWYKYTVNVTSAGSYNLNIRAASPNTNSAYHVEVDGTSVTGSVTIPNTGGWQTYSTLTTIGVSLTAGQHILRLVVDNGGMNFNWISISVPGATATPTPTLVVAIDAGGAANGSYIADTDFDSGTAYSDTSTSISTSSGLDSNPAPQGVYQTVRWNTSFNYTIPNLTANASYTVRLHWAELSFQAAGMRKFNVAINGTSVLSAFDVYATAGYKQAISRSYTATANGSGQIVIAFTNGGADNPFISGIEILH